MKLTENKEVIPCCFNCRFWDSEVQLADDPVTSYCRYNPPTVHKIRDAENALDFEQEGFRKFFVTVWPTVTEYDYCHNFEQVSI